MGWASEEEHAEMKYMYYPNLILTINFDFFSSKLFRESTKKQRADLNFVPFLFYLFIL